MHRLILIAALLVPGLAAQPAAAQSQSRDQVVSAIRAQVSARKLAPARALVRLTDAEVQTWKREEPGAAPQIDAAVRRQGLARQALRKARTGHTGAGLEWPYADVSVVLATSKGTGVALAHALILTAQGARAELKGALDDRSAAHLLVAVLGKASAAPGMGWVTLDDRARLWLRQQLTSGRVVTDETLGLAAARAVGLGGVFLQPLLTGITESPELDGERRDLVVRGVIQGLARLSFQSGHSWNSTYLKTVRPFIERKLDTNRSEQRRAAATFAVWRSEHLGSLDKVGTELAQAAMGRNAARAILIGEVHELARRRPEVAAPLMKLTGVEASRFEAEGPWNLRARALTIAEEHCGPVERHSSDVEEPEDVPEDESTRKHREIIRRGTAEILRVLDAHKGPDSLSLSFRRCEAWLKRYDVEGPETAEWLGARTAALDCLRQHMTAWPKHDAGRLELARVLDDVGKPAEALKELVILVDATDERSRILGSYRLLGQLSPETGPKGAWKGVPRAAAIKATEQVAERGYNPHQRTYARMVRAWLDATGGQPKAAFDRLAKLLTSLRNKDDTFAFAHVGGLIDYANQVAILGEVDVRQLIALYAPLKPAVRRSALLQAAHMMSRLGRAQGVHAIGASLGHEQLPGEAALVLADAYLREYGPESMDENGVGRHFDAESARASLAQLDRLEVIQAGADAEIKQAAQCVMVGYSDLVAAALSETKQHAAAHRVLSRALAMAGPDDRAILTLRLAQVEEDMGQGLEALARYRSVLEATPDAASKRPLAILDYYQLAYRLGETAAADRIHAGKLLAAQTGAIVTAARATYPAGIERAAVVTSLRDALAHERAWDELYTLADVLRKVGDEPAARGACQAWGRGLLWAALEDAGLREHFEKGQDAPLDAAGRCEASVRMADFDVREALGTAADAAAEAVACDASADDIGNLHVIRAEAFRLMGEPAAAAKALAAARALKGADAVLVADMAERIAWTALLHGKLDVAEKQLGALESPQATLWAAHVASATGRHLEAAALFDRVVEVAEAPEPYRIEAARSRLAGGDVKAWVKTLKSVSRSRDAAVVDALVNEIRINGSHSPKDAARLMKGLTRRSPLARGLVAVDKARDYLERKIRPMAAKKPRNASVAMKTTRRLGSGLGKLQRLLAPALATRRRDKTVPNAGVLIPALDVLVAGIEALHSYLAEHEPIMGKSARRADQISELLMQLEGQAIGLGQAAVGQARAIGFASPALRDLIRRLARRFPDDFGRHTPLALICEDERALDVTIAQREGVPGALGKLAAAGHQGLAAALAATCAPPDAGAAAEWAALRFALVSGPTARVPAEVRSGAAADLARHAADGARISDSERRALAMHYAGVDCQRAIALAHGLAQPGATLQRSLLACRDDRAGLIQDAKAAAESGGARALRRLAELMLQDAETSAQADAATVVIKRAAVATGWTEEDVMARPVCAVPVGAQRTPRR